MDRLDRTLEQFVHEGRLSPEVAADLDREYHAHHVDFKQRLAELAGYAGVALAVVGLIVIGSQIWTDVAQMLRASLAALLSAGLLLSTWLVVRSVDLAAHPVRSRLAQVTGEASAVLALLAVLVAFQEPFDDDAWAWKMTLATSLGLLISFVVSRWAPGFISTLGTGVLAMIAGSSVLDLFEWSHGPGAMGMYMVLLGTSAALLLYRWFPPAELTRGLGVVVWLMGCTALLQAEEGFQDPAEGWRWVGRLAAVALVVIGTWMFVHDGNWPWAVGAVVATGLLVGVWSAQALNAGIALVLTGLVLIATGAALAVWRRSSQPPHTGVL